MPFAITALFDAGTEESLLNLRTQLIAAGYGDATAAPVRPHLTLAILDNLDPEPLREALRTYCYATPPLSLGLAAVGTFPSVEGVVYVAPVVTGSLLRMHIRMHRLLSDAGLQAIETYRPHNWVPHCTVAIQLSPEEIGGAMQLVRQADVFHTATLTQVALAEYPPFAALYACPLRGEPGGAGDSVAASPAGPPDAGSG